MKIGNKLFFGLVVCLIMPLTSHAELLEDIVNGKFNAQTVSPSRQDTLLGDTVHRRYYLERDNEHKVFRHSVVADYYVVDTQRQTRKLIGGGQVREATMSPNGRYVAFVKDRNIYIHKLDFGTEVAVTATQDPFVLNGMSDWLYEEEFGETTLMAFSPDSRQLAFIRLDERRVPVHSWETYLDGQYPVRDSLYYPKAGTDNARASVWVYDIKTKQTREINLGNDTTIYIPRVRWTNPPLDKNLPDKERVGDLVVMTLDRDQTKMTVYSGSAKSTVMHPLYTESGKDYYVDYQLFDEWRWLSDNRIVLLSEKDGWRQVYLASEQGLIQKKLSPDNIDVCAIAGVDETSGTVYYAAATTPQTRQLYAVSLKGGTPKRLTSEEGIHSMRLSRSGKQAVVCFQSTTQPNRYTLCSVNGSSLKPVRVLEDNAAVKQAWEEQGIDEMQFLTIKNHGGQELNAWMIRPSGFDATKRYPALIMQYSGPQSQRVLNRWRKRWEYYVAQQGFVVLCVDPRGTDCRGRAWRNETYQELGLKEADDLIASAEWLGRQDYIDSARIALCGWSYGGFQTIMTMCQPSSPFCCGIAIAPVTDWKLYDTGYTERFMRRPQVNFGYKSSDLTKRAADLRGELLIIHGMADDNVHVQNTMVMTEALVQAGKQFEMQLYTDDNHQLRKRSNAVHMHNRMMRFLNRYMKTGN